MSEQYFTPQGPTGTSFQQSEMTDRERAIKAIRRGVPLGQVVHCACNTDPPTHHGCFGVCEDSVSAIIAAFEEVRAEALR